MWNFLAVGCGTMLDATMNILGSVSDPKVIRYCKISVNLISLAENFMSNVYQKCVKYMSNSNLIQIWCVKSMSNDFWHSFDCVKCMSNSPWIWLTISNLCQIFYVKHLSVKNVSNLSQIWLNFFLPNVVCQMYVKSDFVFSTKYNVSNVCQIWLCFFSTK